MKEEGRRKKEEGRRKIRVRYLLLKDFVVMLNS